MTGRFLIVLLGIMCGAALAARGDDGSRRPSLQAAPFQVMAPVEPGSAAPFENAVSEPTGVPAAEPSLDSTSDIALPLAAPSERAERAAAPPPQSPARAMTTVISSLALVLGLFLLVVWVARRAMPKASQSLSKEVVEVLGRAQLTPRQPMHLLRLGRKLILVSITPSGVETISEVTDPAEVDHLLGLCQQNKEGSVSSSFRTALAQLGEDVPRGGFFGGNRPG